MIECPAQAVRARLGRWGTVEEVGPERCRLLMNAESLDWPAMALGSLGAPFDVVRPAEFVVLLRDWADLFSRAAGQS